MHEKAIGDRLCEVMALLRVYLQGTDSHREHRRWRNTSREAAHPIIHDNAFIWGWWSFVSLVLCERVRRHEGVARLDEGLSGYQDLSSLLAVTLY